MQTKIDKEKCIGCGTCCALAMETFELTEDNKAVVKNQTGDSDEDILEAAKACPMSAIEVSDDEGKKLWPED